MRTVPVANGQDAGLAWESLIPSANWILSYRGYTLPPVDSKPSKGPSGTRPLHLLMRYSDRLTGVEDTIAAHQEVAKRKGAVWLGKMGKTTLSRHNVNILNEQCKDNVPTYVFLVQRCSRTYEVYQGYVVGVSRLPPDNRRLIPPYYEQYGIIPYIRLWQKLTAIRKLDATVLKRLYIASSGSSASETLPRSMRALFLVNQRS